MTDLDKLCSLLDGWGVAYKEKQEAEGTVLTLTPNHELNPDTGRWETTGSITGYMGFICEFRFTLDGKFKDIGIWE
jgi:hypothetical protein